MKYRQMLGIEPSKVRTGYAKFDVQNPPLNLALNERPSLGEVGTGHARRDASDCCYAKQDKTWVHDPDGNEWEVFVVLEDNLPETESAGACCVAVR